MVFDGHEKYEHWRTPDRKNIRTWVELRLRQSGIKVFDDEEEVSGNPTLAVSLTVVSTCEDRQFAFALLVELFQEVTLIRDNGIGVEAGTWSSSQVGSKGTGRYGEHSEQRL